MRVFRVGLMFCLAVGLCFGAMAQSITGKLMERLILSVPYRAGAYVFLESENKIMEQSATSGKDGVFLIESVPAGTYTVIIRAEGKGIINIPDVVSSEGSVTDVGKVVLHSECTVSGFVVEPYGDPIKNATVILENQSNQEAHVIDATDETGSYNLKGISTGNYTLKICVNKYFFGDTPVSFTQPAQHLTIPPIISPSIGSISGRVTEADGITGIQDADVQAYQGDKSIGVDFTDAKGNYVIESLPQGVYTVKAEARNYKIPDSRENVAVFHKQVTEHIDFIPAPTGAISGTVYSGDIPQEDVYVLLKEASGAMIKTDKDGKYILNSVEPGTYTLSAFREGFEFSDIEDVVIKADKTNSSVDLKGVILGEIIGRILEADKLTPIPEAHASASQAGNPADFSGVGISNKSGSYEIKRLPVGKYDIEVTFSNDSSVFELGTIKNISVNGGQTTEVPDFIAPGGSISGQIKDASNAPISNVTVEARMGLVSGSGKSDTSGNYYIPYLQEGKYTLEISSDQSVYESVVVKDVEVLPDKNTGNQNVILNAAGTISGKVTDDKGLPVSDANVSAFIVEEKIAHPGIAITDDSGIYVLEKMSAGIYSVMVFADGYPSKGQENISVTAGKDTSDIDFILSLEGETVSGVVYDADTRKPLANAHVFVGNSSLTVLDTMSDSNGNYSISPVPSGTYEAIASAPGYKAEKKEGVKGVTDQVTDGIDFFLHHK